MYVYIYINTYLHTYIYNQNTSASPMPLIPSLHQTTRQAEGTQDPARQQPLVWFGLSPSCKGDGFCGKPDLFDLFHLFLLSLLFWMVKPFYFFLFKATDLTSVDHMTNKSKKLEIPPFSYCMIHTMLWINCHLNCEKLM